MLFQPIDQSASYFSFLVRSTMTTKDMFPLLLIILVVPCSSLGGKCVVTRTQPVMSDLKEGFYCSGERLPATADSQNPVKFSFSASFDSASKPRLQQVMH